MIPLALDPGLALGVAGNGAPALRRLHALHRAGATPLMFANGADATLAEAAGDAFRPTLPDSAALATLQVLWIAGLPDEIAAKLANAARAQRVLVNVEDRVALCDFHSVAEVRRGDLLLTVSTGGKSPGLAARIRGRLAAEYGPEWARRLNRLGQQRQGWRAEGRPMAEVARLTEGAIDRAGWLS